MQNKNHQADREIHNYHAWRYRLHQKINILLQKYVYIKTFLAINKNIKPNSRVIDITCGDSTIILDVAHDAKEVVANDLIKEHLTRLKRLAQKRNISNIKFTRLDAKKYPEKDKFDYLICKNTLHHFTHKKELEEFLKKLKRIAKRVIIMEIEDPNRTTLKAKIWSLYYRYFLKDCGELFYIRSELNNILTKVYKKELKPIEIVDTLKGEYILYSI